MEDLEKLVCVELKYSKLEMIGKFAGPSPVLTGSLVLSSTVVAGQSLQKIVCEMCYRLGWVPLIYQQLPVISSPERSARALAALS